MRPSAHLASLAGMPRRVDHIMDVYNVRWSELLDYRPTEIRIRKKYSPRRQDRRGRRSLNTPRRIGPVTGDTTMV